jgi:hypothetical protein
MRSSPVESKRWWACNILVTDRPSGVFAPAWRRNDGAAQKRRSRTINIGDWTICLINSEVKLQQVLYSVELTILRIASAMYLLAYGAGRNYGI